LATILRIVRVPGCRCKSTGKPLLRKKFRCVRFVPQTQSSSRNLALVFAKFGRRTFRAKLLCHIGANTISHFYSKRGLKMINKSRFIGSVLTVFAAVLMLAVPVAGNAQETSSAVRGVVTNESGSPLANSTVTVLSDNSGFSRSATTSSSGEFTIRGLPIDRYTISVASSGYASQESPGLRVNLGQTANVNFVLTSSDYL